MDAIPIRKMAAALLAAKGVKVLDPEHTEIFGPVDVGEGTIIEPFVVISGICKIGKNCRIKSFSVIQGGEIGNNCIIGPHAYIDRSRIGNDCDIGFCAQLRRSTLGNNVTMHHFGYLGDAKIGDGTNVGAGVITANYGGEQKHKTVVGKNAFLGTGTNLVAPVNIGDEAATAAGSVITKNVPSGTLGIRRLRKQTNKPGLVKKTTTGWKIGKRATKNSA